MFAVVTPILFLLAVAAIYVRADPNPSSPGPGDLFIQGQSCAISWDVDQTGVWKNMNIDLMTGDNFDMVFLTSVATNIDGTDLTKNTFSYTCPQVSPYSAIYFYQFSSPSATNKAWTGRFTITDSVNDIVAPSQSTQPDGESIPWGTGSLVNGSSSAAPSASVASLANTTTTTSSAPPTSSSSSTPSSSIPTQSVGHVTSAAPATTSSVSSTSANDGIAMLSVPNIFQTGLGLGLAALGFSVIF